MNPFVAAFALGALGAAFVPPLPSVDEPIRIVGPEVQRLDFTRTDGGLAPVPSLQVSVVFRADKEHPEKSDGKGWTYHHHPDMACWRGRLYVGWDSCEQDEDTWPSRELFSTSTDGKTWSAPRELFPQGVSTPLRMYFFYAPHSRKMLAIAGLRVSRERTIEANKGPLVVREIRTDHSLGPVYTLRDSPTPTETPSPPRFDSAKDMKFAAACRELLANHLFLLQQDGGALLDPPDRMAWNDPAHWPAPNGVGEPGAEPSGFGKAVSFFRRKDGALVAVMKKRWVTVSRDDGKTWSLPVRPTTLITNMGKVWGQKTPSGKYLLAYNPHASLRFPLAVVESDDGITFRNMRVVHGLLPPLPRYPGRAKSPGASYVRGVSVWSTDGSRKEIGEWLVYSMNKEEIWISHLPY